MWKTDGWTLHRNYKVQMDSQCSLVIPFYKNLEKTVIRLSIDLRCFVLARDCLLLCFSVYAELGKDRYEIIDRFLRHFILAHDYSLFLF